jgi:hypothetical protein
MKRLSPLTLIATFGYAGVALAQSPTTEEASQVQAVDYHYGLVLDIDKVIHITDTSDKVGVVPATITYLDSQGQLRKLNYLQLGGYNQGN